MNIKKNGYYVIGGQYTNINYGWRKTLLGAKRLATENAEFWDNFHGWQKPSIFAAWIDSDYPIAVWQKNAWYDPNGKRV